MLTRISIMVGLVAATLTMGCRNSRETDQMGQPRPIEGTENTTIIAPGTTDTTTPPTSDMTPPPPPTDKTTPPAMDMTPPPTTDTTTIPPGTTGTDAPGAGGLGASDQGAQELDVDEDADTTSRSGAGDTSGGARRADPNVQTPSTAAGTDGGIRAVEGEGAGAASPFSGSGHGPR